MEHDCIHFTIHQESYDPFRPNWYGIIEIEGDFEMGPLGVIDPMYLEDEETVSTWLLIYHLFTYVTQWNFTFSGVLWNRNSPSQEKSIDFNIHYDPDFIQHSSVNSNGTI